MIRSGIGVRSASVHSCLLDEASMMTVSAGGHAEAIASSFATPRHTNAFFHKAFRLHCKHSHFLCLQFLIEKVRSFGHAQLQLWNDAVITRAGQFSHPGNCVHVKVSTDVFASAPIEHSRKSASSPPHIANNCLFSFHSLYPLLMNCSCYNHLLRLHPIAMHSGKTDRISNHVSSGSSTFRRLLFSFMA